MLGNTRERKILSRILRGRKKNRDEKESGQNERPLWLLIGDKLPLPVVTFSFNSYLNDDKVVIKQIRTGKI